MTFIVGLVVAVGIKAVSDLNDGRVGVVVKQILTPSIQGAQAGEQ
jgi:hypothetical protein